MNEEKTVSIGFSADSETWLVDSAQVVNVGTSNDEVIDSNLTYASLYDDSGATYTYSGGNVTISAGSTVNNSYSSFGSVNNAYSQVNFQTDIQDFSINYTKSSGEIYIHSNTGTLTIQNARENTMYYADGNGNRFAYSYLGKDTTSDIVTPTSVTGAYNGYGSLNNSYNTIDKSTQSLYGVIVGGTVNDLIYAGSGGSSLWGGSGSGNDTLVGGAGADEFIYKLGNGNDVIRNTSSNDTVDISSISISQIKSVSVSSSAIYAAFEDGGSLKLEGTAEVGIKTAAGTFAYNHSTSTWYSK